MSGYLSSMSEIFANEEEVFFFIHSLCYANKSLLCSLCTQSGQKGCAIFLFLYTENE